MGSSTFKTKLLRPALPDNDVDWAFLLLPKSASDMLPRRGRTSVTGRINEHEFKATLEPDGKLSHWLKVDAALREAASINIGDTVTVQLAPIESEPEPTLPDDLRQALGACAQAKTCWESTTTLARIDWIHWIESSKQTKTREKRVHDACNMLAEGKKRVCCFDASGYYSKSLAAPQAAT